MEKKYNIKLEQGQGNIEQIIDDMALRVINKSINEFNSGFRRSKKNKTFGQPQKSKVSKKEIA